jgi:hypothetical protein
MTDHEKRHDPPATPPRHQAPPQPVPDRAARAADDKPGARAGEPAAAPFTAEQLVTPRVGEPVKQVSVIAGPHRGSILSMPEAEATQAIDDHWAIELRLPPFDAENPPEHHPLDDAERAAAEAAAQAWADAQLVPPDEAVPPVEPPPEGTRREVKPGETKPGEYETRGTHKPPGDDPGKRHNR